MEAGSGKEAKPGLNWKQYPRRRALHSTEKVCAEVPNTHTQTSGTWNGKDGIGSIGRFSILPTSSTIVGPMSAATCHQSLALNLLILVNWARNLELSTSGPAHPIRA